VSKSDLIDIECVLHHETKPQSEDDGAFLVSIDGERKGAVWVPKSAAQVERISRGTVKLTLSERLATEKGLV
jgi:hypothetical protein